MRQRNSEAKITCADLERALDIVAEVIELYGDTYWPIYDRIEAELDLRKSRKAKLKMHKAKRERKKREKA